MEWFFKNIRYDLKYEWKLSRNSSEFKINQIITLKEGSYIFESEAAPNIRYNETPELNEKEFYRFLEEYKHEPDLRPELFDRHISGLNLPVSLSFAISSVYLKYYCFKKSINLSQFFGITNIQPVQSCYTIPVLDDIQNAIDFYNDLGLSRFKYLKLKLGANSSPEYVQEIYNIHQKPLMLDANEGFKSLDEYFYFENSIKNIPIIFVEEPLSKELYLYYPELKHKSIFKLLADESLSGEINWDFLQKSFHGINMKYQKAGSITRGLEIINKAKQLGFFTMCGCMVESTLAMEFSWLTAQLTDYADLDGYLIIKNEPFNLLKENNGLITKKI